MWLLLARLVTLAPVRWHLRALGRRGPVAGPAAAGATALPARARLAPGTPERARVRAVGLAIAGAAKGLPFDTVCIHHAIAARLALGVRGIEATAFIGVHRDASRRDTDPRGHNAHAWLDAGGLLVTGGPDVSDYVPLAAFGPQAR